MTPKESVLQTARIGFFSFFCVSFTVTQLLSGVDTKTESVELNLDYLREGCGKTYTTINDYDTPHLNSMWCLHIATQEMSAVRCPVVLENFHIFT